MKVNELDQKQSETESVVSMDEKLERKDYHHYSVEIYYFFPKIGFYSYQSGMFTNIQV